MSRVCDVTGTKTVFGSKISHSKRKSNRSFKPNLVEKSFKSDALGVDIHVRVCSRGIRTIYKHGTLDNFILTTKARNLTPLMYKFKRQILRKIGKTTITTAV